MVCVRIKTLSIAAVLISIISLLRPAAFADPVPQGPPTQLPGHNALLMGTDWYPEQWPETRWDTELQMMEDAHLNVIRLTEFAWSRMEPSEGHFDFAWLDCAVRLAEKHHLSVVL